MKEEMQVHFTIAVVVNGSSYNSWTSPKGESQNDFSLPFDLVSLPLVNKRLENAVKEATEAYKKTLREAEAEEGKEE